ncbi:hypothetical protein LALA110947_09535 [Lactococcus laudensis]
MTKTAATKTVASTSYLTEFRLLETRKKDKSTQTLLCLDVFSYFS